MRKSKNKNNKSGGTLCMIRSKITSDMVGLVRKTRQGITVDCPLYIQINTDLRNGNQVIAMVEAIPQTVVDCKSMDIKTSEIIFCEPLNQNFIAYYGTVRNMYYDNPKRVPKIVDGEADSFRDQDVEFLEGATEEEPSPKKPIKKKTQKTNVH